MKTRLLILFSLLVMAALALSACGGGAASATATPKPKGDTVKGKTGFLSTCSACHGPDAKGLPNLGKDMTISVFIKGLTDDQLLDFIKKGRPSSDPANTTKVDMPPKGGNPALTDQDLYDIIAFMRTLSK
ncbi:Cytochrome c-555 [Anaerolineae bacterium]|nr:Cytochrome c-555 [Anaerolineae bacterium]